MGTTIQLETTIETLLQNVEDYVANFTKGDLPLPPGCQQDRTLDKSVHRARRGGGARASCFEAGRSL